MDIIETSYWYEPLWTKEEHISAVKNGWRFLFLHDGNRVRDIVLDNLTVSVVLTESNLIKRIQEESAPWRDRAMGVLLTRKMLEMSHAAIRM